MLGSGSSCVRKLYGGSSGKGRMVEESDGVNGLSYGFIFVWAIVMRYEEIQCYFLLFMMNNNLLSNVYFFS